MIRVPGVERDVILSESELARYSRHLVMPEVGLEGQKKLKASSVLIVGVGGLGTPSAMSLAAAGVSSAAEARPKASEGSG